MTNTEIAERCTKDPAWAAERILKLEAALELALTEYEVIWELAQMLVNAHRQTCPESHGAAV